MYYQERPTGDFDFVEVAAMSFEGNRNRNHLSRQLRPFMQSKDDRIIKFWNSVLSDVPSLMHNVVEELMARVDQVGRVDVEWRGYLLERYGV